MSANNTEEPEYFVPITVAEAQLNPSPQFRCLACGKFAQKLEADNKLHLPPGIFCSSCGWHSARKAVLEHVVPKPLLELLQMVPDHPAGRAQLLAITLVPPPDTVKTFEELKRWFEFDWEKPVATRPYLRTPPSTVDGIDVEVDCHQRQSGTCSYTCTEYGSANYHLDPDELQEISEDAVTLDNFVRMAENRLKEQASEDPPRNMGDNTDEYEYEDYDPGDSGDLYASVERAQLRNLLVAWLRANNPDALDRMEENE